MGKVPLGTNEGNMSPVHNFSSPSEIHIVGPLHILHVAEVNISL